MAEHGPDREKLRQKIQFLRNEIRHLREIGQGSREEFLENHMIQAAATRMLQIGIEAILDSANHIIAREGWGLPKTYQEAIELLIQNDVLPRAREDDLKAMVRFRNRAVHLYDDIDPAEIWKIIQERIGDFEIFIEALVTRYF